MIVVAFEDLLVWGAVILVVGMCIDAALWIIWGAYGRRKRNQLQWEDDT